VVALRSPFLREMGMEFRPFGQGRQEMGLTEVPERVWFEFLRDAVTDAPRGVGRLNYPMTLGSRPAELLQDFAEWFEEKAADGYEYSVPSVADWLGAFSNEAHPAQARAVIRKWFAGEREDGKKFIRSPDVRYGWNQAKHLGSRKENVTPTGFLDMESNVQEIVLRGVLFYVMGAHNGVASASGIERRCLTPRPFTGVAAGLSGAMTGLRLLRRPAMGSTGTSESSAGG
jgi:hypothetical protein